ncbi:hypothetical protein GLYMA_06G216750v4 [Glycine max]|nr:hypothetical protein GLYMA_06G216750v4 [Glycine max]KAH1127021.1 hypothetical protein GYH30_015848 [Glycine max]
MIFLCETLVNICHIKEIKNLLGFESFLVVDANSRSKGLAFLWKHPFDYTLLNYSSNFINVEVLKHGRGLAFLWKHPFDYTLLKYSSNFINVQVLNHGSQPWCLIGFYGFPKRQKRRES